MSTPHELVTKYYDFPFTFRPYQTKTVNDLAHLPAAGYYLDMGLGKTAVSLASALWKGLMGKVDCIIVIMPPAAGWEGQEVYEAAFGQVWRIVGASVASIAR